MPPHDAPPPAPNAAARPSSSAVLWRRDRGALEVFWVRRGDQLRFAGGFFAFPGGRVDAADALLPVRNLESQREPDPALLGAAARELFEETGVLAVAGAGRVPAAERRAAREALLARPDRREPPGASPFAELLARHGLEVDGRRYLPAGRWVTPSPLPVRFDARFYLVELPPGEVAEVWPGELADGEWITPAAALGRWDEGSALLHPPAWHTLKALALPAAAHDPAAALPLLVEPSRAPWSLPMEGLEVRRIEFQRGLLVVPLQTPTLPPATHTNCLLLGEDELWVVDPGSPWRSEQARLDAALDALAAEGRRARGILLTHHHHDHVAGAMSLSARLGIPIAAHRDTAARLQGEVRVDRLLGDGDALPVGPRPWRLHHLPGHSTGHLCLVQDQSRAVVAGDLVAGSGTVVIDPPDGDMADYLASLERLLALGPRTLYPAHGPVVPGGELLLRAYVKHRLEREALVVAALAGRAGPALPEELLPGAYPEVDPALHALAARSLLAHLLKLVKDGRARAGEGGRYALA